MIYLIIRLRSVDRPLYSLSLFRFAFSPLQLFWVLDKLQLIVVFCIVDFKSKRNTKLQFRLNLLFTAFVNIFLISAELC